jgi:hypothetical protein
MIRGQPTFLFRSGSFDFCVVFLLFQLGISSGNLIPLSGQVVYWSMYEKTILRAGLESTATA